MRHSVCDKQQRGFGLTQSHLSFGLSLLDLLWSQYSIVLVRTWVWISWSEPKHYFGVGNWQDQNLKTNDHKKVIFFSHGGSHMLPLHFKMNLLDLKIPCHDNPPLSVWSGVLVHVRFVEAEKRRIMLWFSEAVVADSYILQDFQCECPACSLCVLCLAG